MMDNEYAQYIKLIVIIYQVGAEIFSFCYYDFWCKKSIYFRHVQLILHQKRAKNVSLNATFAWVICLLP